MKLALELEKCLRKEAESKHEHKVAKSINLEILLQEEKTLSEKLNSFFVAEVQEKVNWKKFINLTGDVDKFKDELTVNAAELMT